MRNAGRRGDGADRRGGVASFNEALGRFLRHSGLDQKLRDAAVFGAWREAAGPELAPRARAVRFRDGELTVEVRASALLAELTGFTGEELRRAANARLGAERIARISFQLQR